MDAFFDSKAANVFALGPSIAAMSDDKQAEFFRVCVHFISIVAERGLDGHYVNSPVMEQNSILARRMLGDTFD